MYLHGLNLVLNLVLQHLLRMNRKRKPAKLLALSGIFFCLLNYPLLMAFQLPQRVWGIPIGMLSLFGVWLGFILCLFFIMDRPPKLFRKS